MTRPDRSCTLCGSRAHSVQSCPWTKDLGRTSAATADALQAAIRPESVAADTATRLVNDIASPPQGPLQ